MINQTNVIAPEFTHAYINTVKTNDVHEALAASTKRIKKLLKSIPKKKVNYAYAEGKWTIKEVLQHLIDAERVFSYRALSFSRKDSAALPGFNENNWAIEAKVTDRDWRDMIEEFKAVRKATEALFYSFTDEQLLATGTANNNALNVIGCGFVCAGHANHHINILKERYLND